MLKAGIFVDAENVMRTGGWGLRYDTLQEFVRAQNAHIIRANTYLAQDNEREALDVEFRRKKDLYRSNLRQMGYKVVLKPVRRYRDSEGVLVTKANADLELAVDAIMQARELDYIVLLSGDGDFTRLVTACQDLGCRVDVIGLHYCSRELREAADHFVSGFLIPELLPVPDGRSRGLLTAVNEEKYFGWLSIFRSLKLDDIDREIFIHGNDLEGGRMTNERFAILREQQAIIDFQLVEDERGRRAVNAVVLRPEESTWPVKREGEEAENTAEPPIIDERIKGDTNYED
ncbi:NYN domain-containing protein [bacterium]|nr:NYN domain-containing protein [candidate division CSSED10-310 bacterium]